MSACPDDASSITLDDELVIDLIVMYEGEMRLATYYDPHRFMSADKHKRSTAIGQAWHQFARLYPQAHEINRQIEEGN